MYEPTTNAQPLALTAQVMIPAVAPPTPAAQNTTANPENGSGTPTSASTNVSGGEGDKANAPAAGTVAVAKAVIPSTAVVLSPAAVPSTENASCAHYYLDECTLIKSKPYQNPVIITVLCSLFGGASKPRVIHEDLFVSSIKGKSGKEIPMAMLAMVAVMAEGIHMSKNFESCEACKEYNANIQVLSDLQRQFPLKYHCLMSDLYKLAASAEAPSEDQTVFDFEGMED
ncbi:hypothetical protein V5O48_011570 [Marasmius crinis-equi]|uniref:DUF6532 domain-containing protein n=1 Tax=Marasmius crinis-equi TaxID=585013 RepID=A0ABR3F5L1_9AGAR